jgi:Tol biopolymer transport system component
VFEFARGVETRLTFEQGGTITPQWTRDSKSVMYAGERTGVFEKPADGTVPAKLFFPAGTTATLVGEWSPNGRFLSVSQNREGGVWDIHVVSAEGTPETRKPKPLVQTRFSERGTRFSRDGRYFSYTSDETGRDEAYVRPFDAANGTTSGGQWMISRDGGTSPHWRGDGKEILYMDPGGTLMSVEIDTRSGFQPGAPKPLFKAPARVVFWDVTNDGQRFLIPVPESATSVAPYNVVLNWTSTLKH